MRIIGTIAIAAVVLGGAAAAGVAVASTRPAAPAPAPAQQHDMMMMSMSGSAGSAALAARTHNTLYSAPPYRLRSLPERGSPQPSTRTAWALQRQTATRFSRS